eukprot:CFRG2107T1
MDPPPGWQSQPNTNRTSSDDTDLNRVHIDMFDESEIMTSEWILESDEKPENMTAPLKPGNATIPDIADMKIYKDKNTGVTKKMVSEAFKCIDMGCDYYVTPDKYTYSDAIELFKEVRIRFWKVHGVNKVKNYADEQRFHRKMAAAVKGIRVLLFHNTTGWIALHGAPQYPKIHDWDWRKHYWPKKATSAALSDVFALSSSFQQHIRGIEYSGLRVKVRPNFGVFYPSQSGHLSLFKAWLSTYVTNKRHRSLNVAEVGCGSGVLSLLAGTYSAVKKVHSTDINPYASAGLRRQQLVRKRSSHSTFEVFCGDLLNPLPEEQYDLIIFDGPSIPDIPDAPFDLSTSFPPDLYPRFFEQAKEKLSPTGRLVVMGSDLSRLVGLEKECPVTRETRDHPERFHCIALYQMNSRSKTTKDVKRIQLMDSDNFATDKSTKPSKMWNRSNTTKDVKRKQLIDSDNFATDKSTKPSKLWNRQTSKFYLPSRTSLLRESICILPNTLRP